MGTAQQKGGKHQMTEKRGTVTIPFNLYFILPVDPRKLSDRHKEILKTLDFQREEIYEEGNLNESIKIDKYYLPKESEESKITSTLYRVSFGNTDYLQDSFFFIVRQLKDEREIKIKAETIEKNLKDYIIGEFDLSDLIKYKISFPYKELENIPYMKLFKYKLFHLCIEEIAKITLKAEKELKELSLLLCSESGNIATLSTGSQYETKKRKIFVYPTATIQFLLHKEKQDEKNNEERLLERKLIDILVALSYKLYYVTLSQKVSEVLREASSSRLTENERSELVQQIVKLRRSLIETDANIFYSDPISPSQIERYHFWNLVFEELRIREIRNLILEQINLLGITIEELLRQNEEKQREELKIAIQKSNKELLGSILNFIGEIRNLTDENRKILSELKKLTQEYERKRELENKNQKEESRRESIRNILLTFIALILSITGAEFHSLNEIEEASGIERSFYILSNNILIISTILLPLLLFSLIYQMISKKRLTLSITAFFIFIFHQPIETYFHQVATFLRKETVPSIEKSISRHFQDAKLYFQKASTNVNERFSLFLKELKDLTYELFHSKERETSETRR